MGSLFTTLGYNLLDFEAWSDFLAGVAGVCEECAPLFNPQIKCALFIPYDVQREIIQRFKTFLIHHIQKGSEGFIRSKGMSTYYVSQFRGFLTPLPPLSAIVSNFLMPPTPLASLRHHSANTPYINSFKETNF